MNERKSDRLRFQLLGAPSWHTEGRSGELRGKFALLVAYVATSGRCARDAAVRLIWPGELEKGRNNLRTHVKRLRETTKHPVFAQGDSIELAPGVDCDVFDRPADLATSDLLARRLFLAGTDHPALKGWLEQQRVHWNSLIAEEVVTRATALADDKESAQALILVRKATDMAPWLEGAWRALMWLHYRSGDNAAAADAFARLNQQLRQSGAMPSAETLECWHAIERGAAAAPLRPRAVSTSLLRPPELVGRDPQWAAMASAWQAGRPFLLRGEAGLGKTRLLVDFVRQHGSAVVVDARKGDERAPYSTLGSLLRVLIDLQGLQPDAHTRRQIARLLPELGPTPDAAPADQISLWRAIERLLQEAAESGVQSIALDDLHFADMASLEALRWLCAGTVREVLRFGFATRPLAAGALHELIEDWLTDSQRPEPVEVPPLTRGELARLLVSLDLVGAPASANADDLYAHTGGHPYLVLATLQELSRISPPTPPDATLPKPTKAMPLLERIVRTAPGSALPLLQVAAVLDADIDRAATALGLPAAAVAVMANDLEAHGLLLDGRFVHDLMREAALSRLSPAERRHWHGAAAEALAGDIRVPRARLASHWEGAERWPEAAVAFRAAGVDARDAGRLPEALELLAQAAACCRRCGDRAAEFEALYDSFPGELELHGPDPAEELLARLELLASLPEQSARIAIARATVAVLRYRGDAVALAPATHAMALAAPFADLHGDALAVQALAFAQAARFDEAIESSLLALALAEAGGHRRKAREIKSNLAYVYYEASRFGEAIVSARQLVDEHDAVGDRSSAAGMEGNLAVQLLLSGDPAAAVEPARRAHRRHSEIEASASSPLALLNRTTLASACAFLGHFGEALEVLVDAVRSVADGTPTSIRAKAQLTLAHVWLLLGADEQALAALAEDDRDWPASMQVQRCWMLARAADLRGRSGEECLRRIGAIQAAHWDAPLSRSPWLEWSRQGDAREVASKMRDVQALYEQAQMPGTARAAKLRRIDRLAEIDDPCAAASAADLARELRPQLGAGLHASMYLPEAWAILSTALARVGDTAAAAECRAEARAWIEQVALPNVPPAWRDSFLQRNLMNRELLSA